MLACYGVQVGNVPSRIQSKQLRQTTRNHGCAMCMANGISIFHISDITYYDDINYCSVTLFTWISEFICCYRHAL